MTTISQKEDQLIIAARLMNEEQLNVLVDIVNYLVTRKGYKTSSLDEKNDFIKTLEEIRENAKRRGLTPEILEKILEENE